MASVKIGVAGAVHRGAVEVGGLSAMHHGWVGRWGAAGWVALWFWSARSVQPPVVMPQLVSTIVDPSSAGASEHSLSGVLGQGGSSAQFEVAP